MKERIMRDLKFEAGLIDVIGEAVITTDKSGIVTHWNKAAEKMYGWKRLEAIGKNILTLTPTNQSKEEAEEIMNKLSNGHSWSGEFLVKGKDGREFPAQVTDSPILDSQGNLVGFIGVSSDISERKKLENLLEKSISLAKIGSWEINCKTNEVYWSSVAKEIHGVSENFVPTYENVIAFYNEEDQRKIIDGYQKTLEEKTVFFYEARISTADGKLRWVRLICEPIWDKGFSTKVRGSFQDIDKVKIAELKALRASKEKENILESIGDAFFTLNHEWEVTYWNSEAEKVLQCPRKKILGEKLLEHYDITNTDFEFYYRKAIKDKRTQNFEAFFEATESWYRVNAYPSPEGLSIFFRDITEEKETNFKLKELNQNLRTYTNELVKANKGLEQFSYIISHNLRAPVANLLGIATLLDDENSSDEVKDNLLKGLKGNVKRLDAVMQDLNKILQLKSEHSQERENVNLHKIVHSIKESLGNIIEKKQAVVQTEFSSCEEFNTVPGYLYSIFYNLIFNSIKYSRQGVKPVITIKTLTHDDGVELLFIDNGLGIDLSKKEDEVFGLYKRFHHHVEGKGMGLYLVKIQVEILGGKISVKSKINQGTTFLIKWDKKIIKKAKKNEEVYSS